MNKFPFVPVSKFKFISKKTNKTHIVKYQFSGDAFYWAMQNLDLTLNWEMLEL